MIDLSKIKVGDEVTVRCIVKEVVANDKDLVVVKPSSNPGKYFADMCISKDWIATHTPAPREFKPGERVVFGRLIGGSTVGQLLCVDGGVAWVKWPNGVRQNCRISDLHYVDEGE